MKKIVLAFTLVLATMLASAEPFVWPDAWNVDAKDIATEGRLSLATQSGSRTFNPFVTGESDIVFTLSLYQPSLLQRDPVSRGWIPYAAESYEVSEDGLTVTMTLRDELKWSDGTALTAKDFLFYYTAVTDPEVESPRYDDFFMAGELIGLEAPDEKTLVWTFPFADRQAFSSINTVAAPDHILGEIYRTEGAEGLKTAWDTDTDPSELVWAGPFIMSEYSPDERYTFAANPYFGDWNVDESGNSLPYVAERQYTIADEAAQLNLYVAGETDAYSTGSANNLSVVLNAVNNDDIDAEVLQNGTQQTSMSFYTFNWNKADEPFKQELFRDTRFRQAMSHLTDREAIVDLVDGFGVPSYGPVSPAYENWFSPDAPNFPYDPEAAAALLADMGFTEKNDDGWLVDAEGNVLEFNLASIASNQDAMQVIQIITDTMREEGVKAEAVGLEFSVLVDALLATGDTRPFDAIFIFFGCCTEEWPFFEGIFDCEGQFHMWDRSEGSCLSEEDARIASMVNEGRTTLDDAAAQEMSREILEAFSELQPMIFTTSAGLHYSWLSDVGGEFPPELISSLNGVRDFTLTFKDEQ